MEVCSGVWWCVEACGGGVVGCGGGVVVCVNVDVGVCESVHIRAVCSSSTWSPATS